MIQNGTVCKRHTHTHLSEEVLESYKTHLMGPKNPFFLEEHFRQIKYVAHYFYTNVHFNVGNILLLIWLIRKYYKSTIIILSNLCWYELQVSTYNTLTRRIKQNK